VKKLLAHRVGLLASLMVLLSGFGLWSSAALPPIAARPVVLSLPQGPVLGSDDCPSQDARIAGVPSDIATGNASPVRRTNSKCVQAERPAPVGVDAARWEVAGPVALHDHGGGRRGSQQGSAEEDSAGGMTVAPAAIFL
jgi:hypothetical protein